MDKGWRRTILIIDDDENYLTLLKNVLEQNGYVCHCSSDAMQGIEKLRAVHPDLAILDIDIPKTTGYQVCELIKKILPNTRVIMLSGKFTEPHEREMGHRLGAEIFMTKTEAVDTLVRHIDTLMKREKR